MGNLQIKAWQFACETFEIHSGSPCTLPKHFHDTYQIAFTTRQPGEYICDKKTWFAPPGNIIIFHPGEIHSTVGQSMRRQQDASRLIYVDENRLTDIASGVAPQASIPPVFDKRVITDKRLISRFIRMHALSGTHAARLEKESELLLLLSDLLASNAANLPTTPSFQRNRPKAMLVQDYLRTHYRDNISLETLSQLTHTSPYHLNRLFSREFGMPPHAFQTQVRVEHAKRMLLRGESVAATAASAGFYDQSHLARHFKRIVGVSPQTYSAGA